MYERLADLPADVRQDLVDWLLCLADNKRVLGLRYGEWATGTPELEADVSIAAMAQYELGHARLLRGVLSSLGEDPRDEARQADPASWRNLPALDRPTPGWIEVIALNGILDMLLTVNLESAMRGDLVPLAQRLRKAVSEEQYHSLHAEAWFERLQSAPDELRERFAKAVREIYAECVLWFGPGGDNGLDRLAAAGVLDEGSAGLRARFREAVAELCAPLDVNVSEPEPDAFADWDPLARRLGVPDFDDDSLAMLTGAHARAMGVTD